MRGIVPTDLAAFAFLSITPTGDAFDRAVGHTNIVATRRSQIDFRQRESG